MVSPLLEDRVVQSGATPGHTLTRAFNEKCRDYLQACESAGVAFIPLPGAGARNMGNEEDEAVRHLFQKLGFLLIKRNAAKLLNRIFLPPVRSRW